MTDIDAAFWLTATQVRARFGVSAMSIHRWLHDQRLQFPKSPSGDFIKDCIAFAT
jgi:hypothetical protein